MLEFCYDKKKGGYMSPKKMGRPTNNPKSNRESFRFSDEDIEKLEYCTKVTGKSKVDIIRIGIDKVYKELLHK